MLDHHSPSLARLRASAARGLAWWAILLLGLALGSAGCEATIGDPYAVLDARPPVVDASLPPPPIDAPPGNDAPIPPEDAPVGPLYTCDESYGDAPGYILCAEEEDVCAFSAITSGGTCNQMCAALGGVCIAAYDNDPGAPCVANPGDNCNTAADDEICVCNRQ